MLDTPRISPESTQDSLTLKSGSLGKGKAVSDALGFTRDTRDSLEHLFNVALAKAVKAEMKQKCIQCELIDWPNLKNDTEISQVVNHVNSKSPKLLLSIHGNAAGTGDWKNLDAKATGTVVLYYKTSTKGKKIATDIANNVKNCRLRFGGPDNRASHTAESSVAVLKKTNCPAVLVEACFYDNLEDLYWTVTHMDKLATAIVGGIINNI